jgi:Fe-S-cluster containining protein
MSTDDRRTQWFNLLAQIAAQTASSDLPCAEYCPDIICERDEKLFLLPFEREFICERTGLDLNGSGQFWTVALPSEERDPSGPRLVVAVKSAFQPCPALSKERRCAIHDARPLDCRTFPFIPAFGEEGTHSKLRASCPLVAADALPPGFVSLYERVWRHLSPFLPDAWKTLYWHYRELLPELDDPTATPGHVDLRPRLMRLRLQNPKAEL